MKFEFEIDQRLKEPPAARAGYSSRYWTIGEAAVVVPMATDALQSSS